MVGFGLLLINDVWQSDEGLENCVEALVLVPFVLVGLGIGSIDEGAVGGPEIVPRVPVFGLKATSNLVSKFQLCSFGVAELRAVRWLEETSVETGVLNKFQVIS